MKPSETGGPVEFLSFLKANKLTFSCAESCTGGLIASELTAIPGASEVFWGGVVSYDNAAKIALLQVSPGLLEAHGAVSGLTAEAMARGLAVCSRTLLAVATTGVAGPTGGSPEKPVGTVWFGLAATRQGTLRIVSVKHQFAGSRGEIQKSAAHWARSLVASWWESGMDLDSLRSLTDNEGKPFIEAFLPPTTLQLNPL